MGRPSRPKPTWNVVRCLGWTGDVAAHAVIDVDFSLRALPLRGPAWRAPRLCATSSAWRHPLASAIPRVIESDCDVSLRCCGSPRGSSRSAVEPPQAMAWRPRESGLPRDFPPPRISARVDFSCWMLRKCPRSLGRPARTRRALGSCLSPNPHHTRPERA